MAATLASASYGGTVTTANGAVWSWNNGTSNSTASATWSYLPVWGTASTDLVEWAPALPAHINIPLGEVRKIALPDGTVIEVDAQGNFAINDTNAHVVYRANRVRDFNRFVNASDILEDFIAFVAGLGVTRDQLLALPVELFIKFLIFKAAEADGEDPPDDVPLQHHPALTAPRRWSCKCRACGRFILRSAHEKGLDFCNRAHLLRYAELAAPSLFAAPAP